MIYWIFIGFLGAALATSTIDFDSKWTENDLLFAALILFFTSLGPVTWLIILINKMNKNRKN